MKKFLIFLFMCLFFVSPILAATQSSEWNFNQLTIINVKEDFFAYGDDIELHFQVVNSSGDLLSNSGVVCNGYVYDQDSNLLSSEQLQNDANGFDLLLNLNSSVNNFKGANTYNIYCSSSGESGFISNLFFITPDGANLKIVGEFDYLAVLLILFFISFMSIYISTLFTSEEFIFLKIKFFVWGVLQVLLVLPIFLLTLSSYGSPTAMFEWFIVYFTIDVFLLWIFVWGYWMIVGKSMLIHFTKIAKKKEGKKVKYQ